MGCGDELPSPRWDFVESIRGRMWFPSPTRYTKNDYHWVSSFSQACGHLRRPLYGPLKLDPKIMERYRSLGQGTFSPICELYPIIGLFLIWNSVDQSVERRIFSDLDLWYNWGLCTLQDDVIPGYLIWSWVQCVGWVFSLVHCTSPYLESRSIPEIELFIRYSADLIQT